MDFLADDSRTGITNGLFNGFPVKIKKFFLEFSSDSYPISISVEKSRRETHRKSCQDRRGNSQRTLVGYVIFGRINFTENGK